LTSIAGVVLFVVLFVADFNIYWLIVSPIIIALYQAPAAYLFYLYRKTKNRSKNAESEASHLKSQVSKPGTEPKT